MSNEYLSVGHALSVLDNAIIGRQLLTEKEHRAYIYLIHENMKLSTLYSALESRLKEAEDKYNDLIMSVSRKHENETRHETAKRYIINAENPVVSESAKEDAR